jgi:hypothetical protein
MHALCVFVAHKSTGTWNCYPRKHLFFLYKSYFSMFTAMCQIFVIGRIFGSIFLPNIRFWPKQENPFSVNHYSYHMLLLSCCLHNCRPLRPRHARVGMRKSVLNLIFIAVTHPITSPLYHMSQCPGTLKLKSPIPACNVTTATNAKY